MGCSPWGRKESDTTERLHFHFDPLQYSWASLEAHLVKNLPIMWETWVQSLGWEDTLEKRKAIHSSILAWRIPGMGEPPGLTSMGSHRVRHD